MGASGNTSSSKSSSKAYSKTYLSSLAQAQENILTNRDTLFRSYYFPEAQKVIESFDPDSSVGKAQMGLTANQIDASFNSAQNQTEQSLAQRNITDSGVGMALTAANNRARSSALASAYATQMANSADKKASMLASLGALMPQTTTAAPTLSESFSKGTSSSLGLGGQLSFF